MNEIQKKKCGEIAAHYGKKKQEIQAIQELSELTCLLARRQEQRESMDFLSELKCEIADCLIMIEQLQQIYCIPDSEISYAVDYKLSRQLRRIESEVKNGNV